MQVLIVTGGDGSSWRELTDTTEMFEVGNSSLWTFVAPLPVAMGYLQGVSLDNNIFMFGKIKIFCVS